MRCSVKRYRQYAADCVRQAQSEETLDEKTIMLNVALAWLRLAQQTEAREGTKARPLRLTISPTNASYPFESTTSAVLSCGQTFSGDPGIGYGCWCGGLPHGRRDGLRHDRRPA